MASDPKPDDSLEVWAAAYAENYHRYLAMQPCRDHLAIDWAHKMAHAMLIGLHQRPDRAEIRELAMRLPPPTKPSNGPVPLDTVAPQAMPVGPMPAVSPEEPTPQQRPSVQKESNQLSLW